MDENRIELDYGELASRGPLQCRKGSREEIEEGAFEPRLSWREVCSPCPGMRAHAAGLYSFRPAPPPPGARATLQPRARNTSGVGYSRSAGSTWVRHAPALGSLQRSARPIPCLDGGLRQRFSEPKRGLFAEAYRLTYLFTAVYANVSRETLPGMSEVASRGRVRGDPGRSV